LTNATIVSLVETGAVVAGGVLTVAGGEADGDAGCVQAAAAIRSERMMRREIMLVPGFMHDPLRYASFLKFGSAPGGNNERTKNEKIIPVLPG
jgi:hypothetical protein